jgi:DNA repair protein RadC
MNPRDFQPDKVRDFTNLSYRIGDMAPEERPRERLKSLGADALKTEELLAILLRTGTKGVSAVQMAQGLLKEFGSLEELAKRPVEEIAGRHGVGIAKATQLKAAFELAKRLARPREQQPMISVPAEAAALLREEMRLLDREEFRVLLLNTKSFLLKVAHVSRGSLNASIVEPREVFKDAIAASAAGVILAHNHPSGDPTPSAEDVAITKRLAKAGEVLGITVLDHIILGHQVQGRDRDFVSLKELGLL